MKKQAMDDSTLCTVTLTRITMQFTAEIMSEWSDYIKNRSDYNKKRFDYSFALALAENVESKMRKACDTPRPSGNPGRRGR